MAGCMAHIVGVIAAAAGFLNRQLDGETFNFSSLATGTTVTNGVRVATDGDLDENNNTSYSAADTWLKTGGAAGDYEVRCSVTSGSVAGDTTGSFLALTSSREWYVADSADDGSAVTAEVDITIRHTNGSEEVTFTVTLSAEKVTI